MRRPVNSPPSRVWKPGDPVSLAFTQGEAIEKAIEDALSNRERTAEDERAAGEDEAAALVTNHGAVVVQRTNADGG